MGRAPTVIAAFIVSAAAGVAPLYFVGHGALQWYAALERPALTPPETSFLMIWLGLYVLMALALAFVWTAEHSAFPGWVRFYFIQLLFNAAWVFFFFMLHATLVAFFDMLFVAFTLSALIAGAWEIDKRASYLLAPCFACALFAAFINLNVWLLN